MPCGKTPNTNKLIKLLENFPLAWIQTQRKLKLLQRPLIKMANQFMIGNQINKKEKSSTLKDRLLLIQLGQRKNNGKLLTLMFQLQLLLLLFQLLQLPLLQLLLKLLLHQLKLLLPLLLLLLLKKFLVYKLKHPVKMTSPPNGKTLKSKETQLSKLSTSSSSLSLQLSDFCTLTSKLTKRRKSRKKEKPEQKELSTVMLINLHSLISLLVKWMTHTTLSTHMPEPVSIKSRLQLRTMDKRNKCKISQVPETQTTYEQEIWIDTMYIGI